ncbi:transcription enhancer protein, putative [Entamoeba histolytica HM-1:IMSS-B]|uniref:Transcription enhancer protein, putative n=5 Tax=Entamoeba histolytica TaxID=5759 RepID=M3UYL6_ENTH1|nr:putative transcription enhancer protein [Entamoeba histolytica HM-1:IMSS]EMH76897.1 transcription enhancer protein, putative [Entamoeba histolytica HM-1:IMSS-B]EMS17508.1 transcription enhancer protein, putative [Entamoeba histolytica HM-3:IMSS]ENY61243.1 transcription enhancer protein, putative [Entamoeba histolytica HM-1:IMSS-A]GAT95939.1 putative transcription enhancer protein [Entamoeba histolytica]EAL48820.1 putative transcription enhancer protein [Entamoeba histolytica HM-1:IMSS]|eukprot:XP_654209.1 putative transcription enhancer protein [Entamoeba histolytica HM-1:IMSS]
MQFNIDLNMTLEKMRNPDPDLRYMATSDFNNSLNKSKVFKFDQTQQKKIVIGLLTLLTDETNDVKDIAIKCMTSFAPYITSALSVKLMLEKLQTILLDPAKKMDIHRDVAVEVIKQTLKIFIINKEFKLLLNDSFSIPLLNFFNRKELTDISIGYNLDVLDVIITKNGSTLDISNVIKTLLPYISNGVFANRRRTVQCIAHLSKYADDKQLELILNDSLTALKKCAVKEQMKVYVTLFSSICGIIKDKFGPFVNNTFVLLKEKFTGAEEDVDDDLKEAVLNTYNVFLLSCPSKLGKIADEILGVALEYIQYDPNRFEFDEEDGEAMEEEEEEEEEEEDIFEDEQDVTWKLRKLAGDCINSIILKREDLFDRFIEEGLSVVVKRMKESVEIVLDIILGIYSLTINTINNGHKVVHEKITQTIPTVISQINIILNGKKFVEKSKIECFKIISELSIFDGDILLKEIGITQSVITELLKAPKTHVELLFALCDSLRNLFKVKGTSSIDISISPILISLFENKNFRIAIDAIKTENSLLENTDTIEEGKELNVVNILSSLISLIKSDKDHEVKEQAIYCIGTIIKKFISILPFDSLKESFDELISLYENTFLKAPALIVVGNTINYQILNVLKNADKLFLQTIQQTQQATRQVKVTSLNACKSILESYPSISNKTIELALPTISSFIYDSDSSIVEISVNIISLFAKNEELINTILNNVYRKLVEISKGNNARESLGSCLMNITAILATKEKKKVTDMIMKIENHIYSKANLYLTGLMLAATKPEVSTILKEVKASVKILKANVSQSVEFFNTIVLLYAIGQMAINGEVEKESLQDILVDLLEVDSDPVRQAASMALGSLPGVIPFLFEKLQKKKSFFLMSAMKEAVKYTDQSEVENIIQQLILLGSDDKILLPLSDCFGKLISIDAATYVPRYYVPALKDKNGNAALIGSIKKTCMNNCDVQLFVPLIPLVVSRLGDKTPAIKCALFAVISYLLNHAQKEIYPYLNSILENVIAQTAVDQTYILVAKFGNCKHISDNGLDARKAVYDCLNVLIDNFLNDLDYKKIATTVLNGIVNDNDHDIKLLCFNLLTKMVILNPDPMVENIEDFVPEMRKLISSSLDEKNKDVDPPKQQELSKAVCRFIAKISAHPLANVSVQFEKLFNDIMNSLKMGPIFKSMV